MAKGKPNPNWKQWVLEWKASGKSPAAWSKENKIPYTTFLGWKNRFNKSDENQTVAKPHTGFIELKDQKSSHSGVSLEYNGIKIHLELEFNSIVLKQCLACLRGVPC
jgi:hypothetical protein